MRRIVGKEALTELEEAQHNPPSSPPHVLAVPQNVSVSILGSVLFYLWPILLSPPPPPST